MLKTKFKFLRKYKQKFDKKVPWATSELVNSEKSKINKRSTCDRSNTASEEKRQ